MSQRSCSGAESVRFSLNFNNSLSCGAVVRHVGKSFRKGSTNELNNRDAT